MNPNWNYVPFDSLFEWKGKSQIKSGDGQQTGQYKMFVCSDTEIKRYDKYLISGESIVFGTGGKPSCHYVNEPFAYSTDCVVAQKRNEDIHSNFYYYYFRQNRLGEIQKTFTGSGLQHTSKKKIGALLVPVLPKEEQQRIVERIEEMFSQLDSAVETLQKTKQQLAVYRQAVLKDAFSNIKDTATIREVSTLVTSGSRGWAKYYSNQGAKFIRIGNLTRDSIDIVFDDVQYVELPDKAEGLRSKLQPNDVLVSITADLGSIGLVPQNIGEAYINQHIAVVRFKNTDQGKFMAWYLKSDYGQKDLLKNKRGAGKLGLGLDDIRDSKVPVVSDDVAESIVNIIEARISVCDSIEKTVDTALQQAEAMRQSILKKAFEGKLI